MFTVAPYTTWKQPRCPLTDEWIKKLWYIYIYVYIHIHMYVYIHIYIYIYIQWNIQFSSVAQSCPTLCDAIDGSPPGSPIPGILQARTMEWVAISFSNAWKWKVKVKLISRVWLLATPWTAAYQAAPPMGFSRQEYWSGVPLPSPQTSLSITNSWSLPKLMSIKSMMPSKHLILCLPLLLLPPIPPSIRVFSNESALRMRWPKYWSFSFSISPSNEHPGLISFRMDWLYFLAIQRDSQESSPTPQFKSINSSALSLLHSPTLTSIHDHRKNHSLD